MRTNIVIDDKLMNETLRLTGLKTKREAVELGLQTCCAYASKKKFGASVGSWTGKAIWNR